MCKRSSGFYTLTSLIFTAQRKETAAFGFAGSRYFFT
jgi:hypothetical protein